VTFARLSKLGFPEYRAKSLTTPKPSSRLQASIEPDEQVLCYDFLYYVSTDEVCGSVFFVFVSATECIFSQPYEYEHDYAPAWRNVMTHVHWNSRLQGLADDVVRHVLGLPANSVIPPVQSVISNATV
jgi:hypothetical protein